MMRFWLLLRAERLKLMGSRVFLVTGALIVVFAMVGPGWCAAMLGLAGKDICASSTLGWSSALQSAGDYISNLSMPVTALIFSWIVGAEFGRDTWKMSLPRQAARWPFVVAKAIVGLAGFLAIALCTLAGWMLVALITGPLVGIDNVGPSTKGTSVDVLAQLDPDVSFARPLLFEEYTRTLTEDGLRVESQDQPLPTAPTAVVDLGGGLQARIPTTLGADDTGTLPRGRGLPPSNDAVHSARSTTTRVTAVVQAAAALQAFHPWQGRVVADLDPVIQDAVITASVDPSPTAGLRRLLAPLQDGHGLVMHASDAALQSLPWSWAPIEDDLVITAVAPTGAGGVRPGDRVVSWQGRPIAEVWDQWLETTTGGTDGCRQSHAVHQPLAWLGPAGTAVTLEVEDLTGARRAVQVRYDTPPGSVHTTRVEPLTRLGEGAWYIDLSRINDREWRSTLPKLVRATQIVFDLREYPGNISTDFLRHLSETTLTSDTFEASVLQGPGAVLRRVGQTWHLPPRAPHIPARRAFLAGPRSVSYAESILGVVERHQLGAIVGQPSCGANGNIATLRLLEGTQLRFTGMDTLGPDGRSRNTVGIPPTHPVSRTRAGIADGRDEVLEAALTLLSDATPVP